MAVPARGHQPAATTYISPQGAIHDKPTCSHIAAPHCPIAMLSCAGSIYAVDVQPGGLRFATGDSCAYDVAGCHAGAMATSRVSLLAQAPRP
jgi:hypothetical protein